MFQLDELLCLYAIADPESDQHHNADDAQDDECGAFSDDGLVAAARTRMLREADRSDAETSNQLGQFRVLISRASSIALRAGPQR